jgi:hypothetical protein
MLRYIAIIFLGFASTLQAATVVVNDNIKFTIVPPNGDAHFAVVKTVNPCCIDSTTEISMKYESETIGVTVITLDEQSDWFLVNAGDILSTASISAGQFPVIFNTSPSSGGPVVVGPGEFYLGVRTGAGYDVFPGPPRRNAYGWVHLRPENGVLAMVENVMSYNSTGIIVGTTNVVPEPASAFLALLALVTLATSRR